MLTPVTAGGATDPSRQVLDVGEAQLLTQLGPVPLAFEIEARSLGDAAEKCAAGATGAVERAVKELQPECPGITQYFRDGRRCKVCGSAPSEASVRSAYRESGRLYFLFPASRCATHLATGVRTCFAQCP